MTHFRNAVVGVVAVQILVVWMVLDDMLHGSEFEKALPQPWVWVGISVFGGALIGFSRSRARARPGCALGVAFILWVIPISLLLGIVREVFGVRSDPEGLWTKAAHVLLHAASFSAAVFVMVRAKGKDPT